jgi:cell filamentation protein
MTSLFSWLKQNTFLLDRTRADFAAGAAHFLAQLNAIHAFREGNGRTQLSFLALLAERAGHPFDLDRLDPDATREAMIASFNGDEAPLTNLIEDLAS